MKDEEKKDLNEKKFFQPLGRGLRKKEFKDLDEKSVSIDDNCLWELVGVSRYE